MLAEKRARISIENHLIQTGERSCDARTRSIHVWRAHDEQVWPPVGHTPFVARHFSGRYSTNGNATGYTLFEHVQLHPNVYYRVLQPVSAIC